MKKLIGLIVVIWIFVIAFKGVSAIVNVFKTTQNIINESHQELDNFQEKLLKSIR